MKHQGKIATKCEYNMTGNSYCTFLGDPTSACV